MKLDILLSTTKQESINKDFFINRNINTHCTVVNQNDIFENMNDLNGNTIINSKTVGLAKSRNIALKNSHGDICLLCDDDIILNPGYDEIIIDAYKKYEDADAITFLITMNGKLFDRVNAKRVIKHNRFSILSVGSNEITFKKDVLNENNIFFDERFGLGSNMFESGEETLLLSEMIKKGLIIYHVPIIISNHQSEKGSNAFFTEKLIYSKAAFFRAYDKYLCLIYMIFLYFTKRKIIDKKINFIKYISICLNGITDYDKSK